SDPTMLDLAAESAAPIVLMHWRGYLDQASATFHYNDVVAEVITELRTRIDEAIAVGVDPANIIVDPGLGFSKNAEHNWQILAALDEFAGLDHRLLVAASRKRFISSLISPEDPKLAEQTAKDQATATISALSAQAGAWAVRVHDPATSAIACRVVSAVADHAPSPAMTGAQPWPARPRTASSCAGCECAATTASSTSRSARARTSSSTSRCTPRSAGPRPPTISTRPSTTVSSPRRSPASSRTTPSTSSRPSPNASPITACACATTSRSSSTNPRRRSNGPSTMSASVSSASAPPPNPARHRPPRPISISGPT